jgi:hypothetical protein
LTCLTAVRERFLPTFVVKNEKIVKIEKKKKERINKLLLKESVKYE